MGEKYTFYPRFGKRRIYSALLLWVSSLLGSAGEKESDTPNYLLAQVLLAKGSVLLIFLSFLVAMSTVGLDLSSLLFLVVRLVWVLVLVSKKWFPI